MTCRLEGRDLALETHFKEHNRMVCEIPPGDAGTYHHLYLDNDVFRSMTTTIRYELTPVVYSLSPITGPLSGGTYITVRGSGFEPSDSMSCRFGEKQSK